MIFARVVILHFRLRIRCRESLLNIVFWCEILFNKKAIFDETSDA